MPRNKITTLTGLRRRVRNMLIEIEAEFREHKRTQRGECLPSCEDSQRYWHRTEALEEVLRAAGGRCKSAREQTNSQAGGERC